MGYGRSHRRARSVGSGLEKAAIDLLFRIIWVIALFIMVFFWILPMVRGMNERNGQRALQQIEKVRQSNTAR